MRDQALRDFIDGSIKDLNGEYATAVEDYRKALLTSPNAAIHYAISRDYSAMGNHALAADAAKEAVRLDPTDVTYRENLAGIYLNAMQPELAVREYEEIVRLDSGDTGAWYQLARLVQAQKPLRALDIYRKILEQDGDNWDILLQTATICSGLGRYDEAAEMLSRMVEIDPSNLALRRQLAETYTKAGKTDDALKILEDLVERSPRDVENLAALADVYMERKNYARAVELYEQILAEGIDNPEVKLRVGVGLFGQSERDSTLIPRTRQIFEEVRQALPGDWRAYWYLGAIAASSHQDSLASGYFERVTALASWNGDAWWFLGTNYFDKGQYDQALDVMQKARKAVPRDHRVYLLIGLIYSRTNRQEEAVPMLEKALQMDSTDMNTLSSLALSYESLKRYTDSDRTYEQALIVDPKSALILNNYSYSLAERGLQLQRALEMATKAVNTEPENPSYLDTIGWIYYKLGQFDTARSYVEKAVKREGSSVVNEHLGDIYYRLGQTQKAVGCWKKASEIDPSNTAAHEKAARGTL